MQSATPRRSRRSRALLTVAIVASLAAATAGPARARDLILEGPHPFLKDNALSVSYLMGTAVGHSFSGQGIGLGFGYMIDGPLWLDLQFNFRGSTCSPWRSSCDAHTGNDAEVMAGIAWRVPLSVPLVPFARLDGGPVFLYPDGGTSAMGLAVRGGAGARYYVFDWLGFGAELAMSLGHGFFADGYAGSRTYAVVDVIVGTEVQFE